MSIRGTLNNAGANEPIAQKNFNASYAGRNKMSALQSVGINARFNSRKQMEAPAPAPIIIVDENTFASSKKENIKPK